MFRGKTKKLLSLLAAAAMAVTALTSAINVSAADIVDTGECGSGITWTLDSEGKLTISGEGEMVSPNVKNLDAFTGTLLNSPANLPYACETQLKDYPEIYTYQKYANDIKEVEIKEGVTSIGFAAFYKMPNLETVVLPKTISNFKGIGYGISFRHDSHGSEPIGAYASMAFAECTKLKNLTLSEGMTAIGSIAFYGCTALESVRIPSTILSENVLADGLSLESNYGWGPFSFVGCTSLKNITLPEGLTVIGAAAFENTAVESVVIPSTIKEWASVSSNACDEQLGNGQAQTYNVAFANCKNLSSVTFTEGLQKIKTVPFSGCPKLTRVFVPKSITDLGYAFANSDIQEVCIEEGTVIGTHTNGAQIPKQESDGFNFSFNNCKKLKKLEIPSGIVTVFNNAKWCTECDALQDVYLHGKDISSYIPVSSEYANFHCYFNSTTYNTLTDQYKNNIPTDRLVNIENDLLSAKDTLNTKLKDAKALNENDYTAESYAALKTAIENAEKFDENYTGVLPLKWAASDITSATRKLEEKPEPADYTAVDAALAKIPSDLSIYTDESVNALNDAKEAVVRDLTIDEQERVNGFAKAIEEAIAGLIKKQNSNTGTDNPQNPNPNNNTNKPNQPTSSKDKGKTPTNKVTVPKPAQVKSVKATAKKKKLNVSWKKVSGATGYEVMYATNNKFTKGKKTVKVKKNKVTLKKLKAKKKYFVKVRAYKKVKSNVSYGKWSKVVKKKTK